MRKQSELSTLLYLFCSSFELRVFMPFASETKHFFEDRRSKLLMFEILKKCFYMYKFVISGASIKSYFEFSRDRTIRTVI